METSSIKALKEDLSTSQNRPKWVLIVSVVSALVFIVAVLAIAIFIPHPTTFQIFVFRIVLALAAAAFGATIPGLLNIRLSLPAKSFIQAGGAIGLFTLVFLINPPLLVAPDPIPPPILTQKLTGTILDQHSEPLTNVLVTLPEMNQQTLTDEQGFFSFELEAEKGIMVHLMAQKDEFNTYRKTVPLGTTGHTFKMERKT